ncbi:MAG: HlyC/CorC family transporter [Mailhella sp.]|nr:HlyC/CorC family transporter [Mailhella sp.]
MDADSHSSLWSRLTHIFGSKSDDHIEQAILEAREEGELKAEEGSMMLQILELNEIQVQELMTPRTDIDCLPAGTSIRDAASTIVETGHSRLPIFKDTRDNIIGIIYAKDLLPCLIDTGNGHVTVESIMRPPFFVPETKISSELLQEFRARKNHIAIVVDEYGGTSGLVTIEDLLEVIVGDIEDEHDAPKEEDIIKLSDSEYELNGRAYLEDLGDCGIDIESDEVDTIGGYLCQEAGRVPAKGESFTAAGWSFTVLDADAKQIHKIRAVALD